MAAQLLLSVDFMSRKGVLHRDLKNILLGSLLDLNNPIEIRVADFGFATFYDETGFQKHD